MPGILQYAGAGADGPVAVDIHNIQIFIVQIFQIGVEILVHHGYQLFGVGHHIGLELVALSRKTAAPHALVGAGHGDKVHIVNAQGRLPQYGLLPKPEDILYGEICGHVLCEHTRQIQDGGGLCYLCQQLLHNGFEQLLLGLDTADVSVYVSGVVVAVPEPEDLHHALPIQMLHPLGDMDMQVLGRIVVIHVDGDLKVHAANGLRHLAHGLPLHHYGKVGDKAHQLAHLVEERLDALVSSPVYVIDGVDALDVPGDVDHGVTGNVHDAQLLIGHIVGHQHHRVGVPAAARVPPNDEKGEEIFFPPAVVDLRRSAPRWRPAAWGGSAWWGRSA